MEKRRRAKRGLMKPHGVRKAGRILYFRPYPSGADQLPSFFFLRFWGKSPVDVENLSFQIKKHVDA